MTTELMKDRSKDIRQVPVGTEKMEDRSKDIGQKDMSKISVYTTLKEIILQFRSLSKRSFVSWLQSVFVSNWQELNLKTDTPHFYCNMYVRMFLVIAFSNIP